MTWLLKGRHLLEHTHASRPTATCLDFTTCRAAPLCHLKMEACRGVPSCVADGVMALRGGSVSGHQIRGINFGNDERYH